MPLVISKFEAKCKPKPKAIAFGSKAAPVGAVMPKQPQQPPPGVPSLPLVDNTEVDELLRNASEPHRIFSQAWVVEAMGA